MPKFAYLTDQHAARIAVNPAAVRFVREPASKRELVHIELTEGRVSVSTPFDEVMQTLEAVDALPAAAPIIFDRADLELAAKILDLVGAGNGERWSLLDAALGLDAENASFAESHTSITALAARLRGLAR